MQITRQRKGTEMCELGELVLVNGGQAMKVLLVHGVGYQEDAEFEKIWQPLIESRLVGANVTFDKLDYDALFKARPQLVDGNRYNERPRSQLVGARRRWSAS
jgi:hypothetical protein